MPLVSFQCMLDAGLSLFVLIWKTRTEIVVKVIAPKTALLIVITEKPGNSTYVVYIRLVQVFINNLLVLYAKKVL